MATGALAGALDFDDTHPASLVHASAVIIPAALAAGEEHGADGRTVIAACAAGYEVAGRLGAAAGTTTLERGLHATGVFGPFGAAAAAGRVWGLTPEQMASAFGIAGSQAAGILASLADVADTLRFHAGWAAQAGVIAADLARRGLTGPANVLDGPHGIFQALLGTSIDEKVALNLGNRWEASRVATKPYAASHFVQACMDAAASTGVRAGDIEEVMCFVPAAVVPIVCEPRAAKTHPATPDAARQSLPFAVATILAGGRSGPGAFGEEALNDRRVITLAQRVFAEADPTLDFPAAFGGRVRIVLRDGRIREASEAINRGHPDRPLSEEELRAKFVANARKRLDNGAVAKLAETTMRLDELDSVEELTALAQVS
jgi:2-methylcitrate dehydratase PrpD